MCIGVSSTVNTDLGLWHTQIKVKRASKVPADAPEQREFAVAVTSAESTRSAARKAVHATISVACRPSSAVKQAARQSTNGRTALKMYDVKRRRLWKVQEYEKRIVVKDYRERVRREGVAALRVLPIEAQVLCTTHAWPAMSEYEAIAFGLDRCDRTQEKRALSLLPRKLQWEIVDSGALQLLPSAASILTGNGRTQRVYHEICKRADNVRWLKCVSDDCGRTDELPMARDALLKPLVCTHCHTVMKIQWSSAVAEQDIALLPLASGATAALGNSLSDSYGVWHKLCSHSIVGARLCTAGEVVACRHVDFCKHE